MLLGALCPAHRVNVRDRLGRRLPDELKAPSTLCSFQLEGVHRPITYIALLGAGEKHGSHLEDTPWT